MEDLQQDTDWHLVQECLQQDRCAWEVLVERKTGTLYASLWFHLGAERFDRFLLEDLAQTVWLALLNNDFEQLRRYQPGTGSFNAYLRQLALQVVHLHHRATARHLHPVPLANQDRPDPGAANALEQAAFAEYEALLTPEEYAFLHGQLMKVDYAGSSVPRSPANQRVLTHRLRKKWRAYRNRT